MCVVWVGGIACGGRRLYPCPMLPPFQAPPCARRCTLEFESRRASYYWLLEVRVPCVVL